MRLLFLCALALAACQSDPEVPVETEPVAITGDFALVDDGTEDEGFVVFRDTLRAVVARRDTAELLALTAEGARLSYDDAPGGPDGLRALWFEGDTPTGAPIWTTLAEILDGGSVDEEGAITVPWIAVLWPHEELDPYAHVAVLGEDVPAYDAPGGTVLATLTETAVATTGEPRGGWQPVALPDGRQAVVADSLTLSPVGYRAAFWDDGDGWRLRSLLAGD